MASRAVCRWAGSSFGVEGELAQEFAGVGVDDADVQVLDQEQDAGSGVGASEGVRGHVTARRAGRIRSCAAFTGSAAARLGDMATLCQ